MRGQVKGVKEFKDAKDGSDKPAGSEPTKEEK